MKKVIILAAFFATSAFCFAQKPQPVYSIIRQVQNFDWYEEQAKAWKHEIDNGTTNPMAWVYWNEANRMAANFCNEYEKWKSKNGSYFMPQDSILKSAETHIPNTFEYYFLKMRYEDNRNVDKEVFNYWLFKAQEIRPYDDLLFPFLLNYYLFKDDKPNIEFTCKKWFESNEIPMEILTTLYNMLISLDKNAILLVNGDNDTYPCWVLQNAKNIRPDVLVMNISLACGVPQYRKNIFAENEIKPLKNDLNYVTNQELIKHLIENIKNRPIYMSAFVGQNVYKEYENKMYHTGLAFKYSEKPFNNLEVLRDNVENKFLLDFLKESFYTTHSQTVINIFKASHLSMFLQLYNHYKQTGKTDKAQKIKELSIAIAKNSEWSEWLNYFEK